MKGRKEWRVGRNGSERKTALRANLRLAVVEWRGRGGLFQTDNIGNSGVTGVQPSIKCNLMLQGMFMCSVSDSPFDLDKFPVLINDLMGYPHFSDC